MGRKRLVHAKVNPSLMPFVAITPWTDLNQARNIEAIALILCTLKLIPHDKGRPRIVADAAMYGLVETGDDGEPGWMEDFTHKAPDTKTSLFVAAIGRHIPGFDTVMKDFTAKLARPFVEIVAVLAKKDIRQDNFKSWLAMVGIMPEVVNTWMILHPILRAVPSTLQKVDEVSDWAAYHLTATSTVGLVKKFMAERKSIFVLMCPLYSYKPEALEALDEEDGNHGIPSGVIAETFCYLAACGYDFGNWYQGQKAISEQPGAFKNGRVSFYRRYLEVTSTFGDMSVVDTADELNDLFVGKLTIEDIEARKTKKDIIARMDTAVINTVIRGVKAAADSDTLTTKLSEVVTDRANAIMAALR